MKDPKQTGSSTAAAPAVLERGASTRRVDLRPSERNLPALRMLCDEFLRTGDPPLDHAVAGKFGQRSVYELRLLGLVRHRSSRVYPTRNGVRRASHLDALRHAARLYRALQAEFSRDRARTQWLVGRVADTLGCDESTARIAMLLVDDAPYVHTPFVGGAPPVVYVANRDEFLTADASALESVQPEVFGAPCAEALRLRYDDGDRRFPFVLADDGALAGAMLDGIEIECGTMVRADLRGASLRAAKLGAFPIPRGAAHHGLALVQADLARADLSGADLRATDLREASLEGARLDDRTSIPPDALTSASWTTLYRCGAARQRGESWEDAAPVPDEAFRFVYDAGADSWEVFHRGARLASVASSIGVQIAALLVAHPGRTIHALDLDSMLAHTPTRAAPLAERYESTDPVQLLTEHGLPRVLDLSPEEIARLRASLRACDRLAGTPSGEQLKDQLQGALARRSLKLGELDYAKKTTDRLRRAFGRARDTVLAAAVFRPLVRDVRVAEFARYTPSAS